MAIFTVCNFKYRISNDILSNNLIWLPEIYSFIKPGGRKKPRDPTLAYKMFSGTFSGQILVQSRFHKTAVPSKAIAGHLALKPQPPIGHVGY